MHYLVKGGSELPCSLVSPERVELLKSLQDIENQAPQTIFNHQTIQRDDRSEWIRYLDQI